MDTTSGSVRSILSPTEKCKNQRPKPCASCKRRKIRCDTLLRGSPCTNCRYYGEACLSKLSEDKTQNLRKLDHDQLDLEGAAESTPQSRTDARSIHQGDPGFSLPTYVQQPRALLQIQDMELLRLKGALSVPNRSAAKEIYLIFLDQVYPYMPIISLKNFYQALITEQSEVQVSLFVFQSMIAACIPFLSPSMLSSIGFDDHKIAQAACISRTKLLYNLEVESDPVGTLQGLILLAFWNGIYKDSGDCRYWAGLSLTWAMRVGVHQAETSFLAESREQRGLYRRLWWTVVTRDCLTALWTHHPPSVNSDDFDVPILRMDDFDTCWMDGSDNRTPRQWHLLGEFTTKEKVLSAFIDISSLCVPLGHVLRLRYSIDPCGDRKLTNEGSNTTAARKRKCESDLQQWLSERTSICSVSRQNQSYEITDGRDDTSQCQLLYVQLLYFVAFQTLFLSEVTSNESRPLLIAKALIATTEVLKIIAAAREMETEVYSASLTLATGLFCSIAIYSMAMNSSDETARLLGCDGLENCVQMMTTLNPQIVAIELAKTFRPG